MKKCRPVQITVRAGENADTVWWGHVRAALGEGCCPRCGCRLDPIPTQVALGGACWHCDHAWAMDGATTNDWRLHNPHSGERMPLTRMSH